MPDRLRIDIHVPAQKVFCLRIVGATEHFLNKNVSPTGHGEQPEDHGENESDRQQIRRFVSLKPEDRDAHYFLANLLSDQGRDDEAIQEFEQTISIDPNFLEAYFYLGEHYENLEDYERAEKCFEHILRSKNDHELAEEARAKLESLRNKDELSHTPKD